MTILSLCDYTGVWSDPYREAGFEVEQYDLKHGHDVRLLKYRPGEVFGIIAQPPCTHLAGSGARWWRGKGDAALFEALALVDACLRMVALYQPEWWVLENPVGRLVHYLGKPRFTFDPHEFAGWADDPDNEAYTKRTCLWGTFTPPEKRPVPPVLGSIMHRRYGGSSKRTKEARSVTPQGFARAFFEANKSPRLVPPVVYLQRRLNIMERQLIELKTDDAT